MDMVLLREILSTALIVIGVAGLAFCLYRAVGDIEHLKKRTRLLEDRQFRDSGGAIRPGLTFIRNRSGHPERMYVNPWVTGSDEEASK